MGWLLCARPSPPSLARLFPRLQNSLISRTMIAQRVKNYTCLHCATGPHCVGLRQSLLAPLAPRQLPSLGTRPCKRPVMLRRIIIKCAVVLGRVGSGKLMVAYGGRGCVRERERERERKREEMKRQDDCANEQRQVDFVSAVPHRMHFIS
jgi:hypothetical protein